MGDNGKQNLTSLRAIFDLPRSIIALILTLAGLIIAFRNDYKLFVVILASALIVISAGVLLYLVLARSRSHIVLARSHPHLGKTGPYRFDKRYRVLASIGMALIACLVIAIFSIESSRNYIISALTGTDLATISNAPIPATSLAAVSTSTVRPIETGTSTATNRPTATLTPTQTLTPTITSTPTQTLTPTPKILFKDDFNSNNNAWRLITPIPNKRPNYEIKILRGQFIHNLIECPANAYCPIDSDLPKLLAKNFQLEFDAKLPELLSSTARIIIGVRFRYIDFENFYIAYFRNDGTFGINLIIGGRTETIQKHATAPGFQDGKVNKYRISAQDHQYQIFLNEKEISSVVDGNILSDGKIFISTQLYTSGSIENATIEYDNFTMLQLNTGQ